MLLGEGISTCHNWFSIIFSPHWSWATHYCCIATGTASRPRAKALNSLLINISHLSPGPLPRTNTVETGGSSFSPALGKFSAEVFYCQFYAFTVMAVRTSGCTKENVLASTHKKKIIESNLSLMYPFLKKTQQKSPSIYTTAWRQRRNKGLISRQKKGINVENTGTMQRLEMDSAPNKAMRVHFNLWADNTASLWSLCVLRPFLHIYVCVYIFMYINKLAIIYISVQNKSKLSYQNAYTCQQIWSVNTLHFIFKAPNKH